MNSDQIAVQMYTLRDHAQVDLDAVFWRLAEIGYRQVEFAGYYGYAADEIAAMLERHGLRAPASHIPYDDFLNRRDKVLDDAKTLGVEWLIVPMAPVRDASDEEIDEIIANLDIFGRAVTEAGYKFGYHNHAVEFQRTFDDGTTLFDRILNGTDAGHVKLELDAFWAHAGGYDPAELLRQHGDRVRLLHIKDAATQDPTRDVPFGEGSLGWASILPEAERVRVEYYVVEQDNPGDAFTDVKIAFRNAEEWSGQ